MERKFTAKIKEDNDVFIGVTGLKGSGNNSEIFQRLHNLPKYSPIVGDEGIRFAWSRDWNKADNKDLIRLMTQIRPKKHILYMNIPKLAWVDKSYRESMLDIWAWVHGFIDENGKKHSEVMIFEPDGNQGEQDSWHLKKLIQATKRVERIGRFSDRDKVEKIVRKHPCFVDMFPFPKVPEEIYEAYLKLRHENVMSGGEGDYLNQKDMAKNIFWNLRYNWDKFAERVNAGRVKRPSIDTMSQFVTADPVSGKPTISPRAIAYQINEIEEKRLKTIAGGGDARTRAKPDENNQGPGLFA